MLSSASTGAGTGSGADASAHGTGGAGRVGDASRANAENPPGIATSASLRGTTQTNTTIIPAAPLNSDTTSTTNTKYAADDLSTHLSEDGVVSLEEMLYEAKLRIAWCYRLLGEREVCRLICHHDLVGRIAKDEDKDGASGGDSGGRIGQGGAASSKAAVTPARIQTQTSLGSAYALAHARCILGLLHEDTGDYPAAELAYRGVLDAVPGM